MTSLSAAEAQHSPTREAPGSEQLKQQDQPARPEAHADREPSHTLSHPQAGSHPYTALQVLPFSSQAAPAHAHMTIVDVFDHLQG